MYLICSFISVRVRVFIDRSLQDRAVAKKKEEGEGKEGNHPSRGGGKINTDGGGSKVELSLISIPVSLYQHLKAWRTKQNAQTYRHDNTKLF